MCSFTIVHHVFLSLLLRCKLHMDCMPFLANVITYCAQHPLSVYSLLTLNDGNARFEHGQGAGYEAFVLHATRLLR